MGLFDIFNKKENTPAPQTERERKYKFETVQELLSTAEKFEIKEEEIIGKEDLLKSGNARLFHDPAVIEWVRFIDKDGNLGQVERVDLYNIREFSNLHRDRRGAFHKKLIELGFNIVSDENTEEFGQVTWQIIEKRNQERSQNQSESSEKTSSGTESNNDLNEQQTQELKEKEQQQALEFIRGRIDGLDTSKEV